MKQVHVTIDGKQATTRPGQTVLQAAREQGIAIPTLCNYPGLEPLGGCRVCIVEIDGFSRPQPACATAVTNGMIVTTCSSRLQAARRLIVELLLAERNHTCPVCVMEGNCELQALARSLGIDHLRYAPLGQRLPVDLSRGRFAIDHNRCILCRRCVRVCDRVEGAHTWDVSGRGVASRIISDLADPWGDSTTCSDCGKCVRICPTGALSAAGAEKDCKEPLDLERLMEWRERKL